MKRGLSGHGRVKIYRWVWIKEEHAKEKKDWVGLTERNGE